MVNYSISIFEISLLHEFVSTQNRIYTQSCKNPKTIPVKKSKVAKVYLGFSRLTGKFVTACISCIP